MRVKRFVGENVAETMGKVKRELGSDAVILQTRQFKEGGFFGLFGKVKVEITAAIEEKPAVRRQTGLDQYLKAAKGSPVNSEIAVNSSLEVGRSAGPTGQRLSGSVSGPLSIPALGETWVQAGARAAAEVLSSPGSGGTLFSPAGDETLLLQQELGSMRQMLEKMTKRMEELGSETSAWPPPLQVWANTLRQRGINESLVRRLLRQVQQTLREDEWANDSRVRSCIDENVRKICANTTAIQPGVQKPRVVALIGPTGVGKTTTIGKLAAGFSIVDKRRVALITADTYRVAAVEQLKTFGEIIGVPVEVVMTPSGLREALSQHSDKELIFIDTAGRSPQHDLHMSELRALLEKAKPDLSMLVMSATTNSTDQLEVYRRFEQVATHLIFTKLDETSCVGSLLNLIDQTPCPIAYLTTGQNVPDDIEVATPERLTRWILGEATTNA